MVDETTGEKKMAQDFGNAWPGTMLTQIPGTDIWQARIPYGATKIIFNSGVKDSEVVTGVEAYQTDDLDFDAEANKGQIYTIDVDNNQPTPGKKLYKTKFKYAAEAGAWTDYAGEYAMEQFGTQPVDPQDVIDDNKNGGATDPTNGGDNKDGDNKTVDPTPTTGGNTQGNVTPNNGGSNVPQTGDVAMAAIFVAVAAAALGAVVLAAKKKERV
jgi:LPXTG-motif cell wall-anchored protein